MASEQTDNKPVDKSFAFLLACLKHSSTGKTDWEALVKEEEIVTVNAAKKRWKRLMDAYGLSENCLTACSPKKGGKGSARPKVSRAKKRKAESEEDEKEKDEKEKEEDEKEKEKEKEEDEKEKLSPVESDWED